MWRARAVAAAVAVAAVVAAASGGAQASSKASLEEQGYKGVVVALSPALDQSQASELISAVTDMVTEASQALYTATHNMLYLKRVQILIPSTWSGVPAQPATFETFEESDIRVDQRNLVYGDQPYLVQPGRCGEPGRYIHLTPQYLTLSASEDVWGPRGKVLTQLWARLRWGVFDEVGYPGDSRFPLFYDTWNDQQERVVKPNHCADKDITGRYVDLATGGECAFLGGFPDQNCRFMPDAQQDASTSLMSFANLNDIEDLCEVVEGAEKEHDPLPPNRHNLLCEGRSVWEVMRRHSDFLNVTRMSAEVPAKPEVVVVQQVGAKFALVLDHSGSMAGQKITVLQNTARRWILHDVADGSSVAIINFGQYAELKKPLTVVSNSTRQELAAAITKDDLGRTCIGCGLAMAVEQLEEKNNTAILLITDGENTSGLDIDDVMDDVVKSGARVIAVSYGNAAEDTLEDLAQNTGGKAYIVPADDDGSMLDDAFQGSLTYQPGDSLANTDIKIHESELDTNQTLLSGTFVVDVSVGRNLQFRFDADKPVETPPVLKSPSGDTITDASFSSDANLWTIKVDLAESGEWTWEVGLPDGSLHPTHVKVAVTAQARDPASMPIHTESWMSTGVDYVNASAERVIVFARVLQGDNPVVGARVRAYVTTPVTSAPAVELDLLDNGQGADVQEGDGVYSRYFTQYTETGRYAVKAQVWDEGGSFINNGFITSRRRRHARDLAALSRWPLALTRRTQQSDDLSVPEYCCGSVVPFDPATATPTGSFTRTAAAGSFHVVEVPPAGMDSFPPERVLDLASDTNSSSSFTLCWTAPGDDLDIGTVAGYEVRMSPNPEDLLEGSVEGGNSTVLLSFEQSQNHTELLLEAGTVVALEVDLEKPLEEDKLHFVALRAVDEAGNVSPVSNRATVLIRIIPTTEPSTSTEATTEPSASTETTTEPSASTETTTEPSASTETTTEPSTSTDTTPPPKTLKGWEIALIVIGSVIGVALLVVVGCVICKKCGK